MASILYIEDDEQISVLLKVLIEDDGHHVDVACNGQEGLKLYDAKRHDVVLVEYCLPDMDGLEVCQTLLGITPDIPLAIITSKGSEGVAAEALRLGIKQYIIKETGKAFHKLIPAVIDGLIQHLVLNRERKASEVMLKNSSTVLAKIVNENSLEQILSEICVGSEEYHANMRCTVLLYDPINNCVKQSFGPSMPQHYNEALVGLIVGEGIGSCGTAMARGERIDVSNIYTHPFWKNFLKLAEPIGIKACWSQPIFGKNNEILGTFAIYHNDVRSPEASEIHLIESQAKLASIAIQKDYGKSELQEKTALLEISTKLAKVGYMKWNTSSNECMECSDTLAEIYGVDTATFKEKYSSIDQVFKVMHPDDYDRLIDKKESMEIGSYDAEYRITNANGELRHIREISLCDNKDPSKFECISIAQDITEQKQNEFLMHEAKEKAERSSRSKTQFLAHVSHELRSPLNAILGFSQVLTSELYGAHTSKKYLEYSHDIIESGMHLLHLINDILDISKVESGETYLDEKQISIEECIMRSIKIGAARPDFADKEFNYQLDTDRTHIRGDERLVNQVLINLIVNAAKFSAINGQIMIKAEDNEDRSITIKIIDNGRGIPEEDLELIQTPFGQSRVDPYLSHEGAGLGLSISKSLMELHGGTLTIESEVNIGTTVLLRFPIERSVIN